MLQKLRDYLRRLGPSSKTSALKPKPAIALITYCRIDYFDKVLESILSQTINQKPFSDYFDLIIFQDGLLPNDSPENTQGHKAIADQCRSRFSPETFISQSSNLGVALHFDLVERHLFEKQDRPWAVFCEDDLVLAPGYLETLLCMAKSFEQDPRIAMFSCFGQTFRQPVENQQAHQNELISMSHHWAFGLYQRAWRQRQALVDEYLQLVANTPYRQRDSTRIQNWHIHCGFKPGPTSQDYAKACSMAALGLLKVSSYANFGSYIGERGLHFTPEIYERQGFGQSHLYPSPITQPFNLDEETFLRLLAQQRAVVMEAPEKFDQALFVRKLESGSFSPKLSDQWQKNAVTEADVVAAYKMFLGRLPESRAVIEARIGLHPDRLFGSFITSAEFRARKQFSPIILALAKEIIEENKKMPANAAGSKES